MTNGIRRQRAVFVLAFVAMLSVLAVSCSSNSSTNAGDSADPAANPTKRTTPLEADDEPQRGGRLVVAVPSETNGWNPSINQWADAGSLEGSSFLEPLSIVDPSGEAQPWLAESWKPNADFTEWEITLKPNIKFHNGEPLDGKALKLNLEGLYQGGLTKVALESQYDHVEQTGPLSAHVYLKHPWSQYPVALNNAWMMAPEMLAREDKGVVNPIGTGPFVFGEWQQGKFLRAKKNPDYWRKDEKGRQLPFLDEIEFRPMIDDDAKQKALQANDVDFALTTSAELAAQSDDAYTVLRDFTSERTFIMLNTTDSDVDGNKGNPFTNVHARRAIAYATNRAAVADQVGEGVQTATQGYRPESKWGLPEDQTGYPAFDLTKAKAEVEAYKKDTGKPSLTFTLTGLTNIEDQKIMQMVQDQWKQAGIEANIDAMDQVKYITTIALGLYQAGWFRWYGYLNPDSNYVYNAAEDSHPAGQLSINFTHYTSDSMQKNLEDMRKYDEFAKRKAANDAVVKETNDQAINIWLYDTPYSIITAKKVRGLNSFRTNPFGNFSPKPWWGNVWIQK